MRIQSPVKHLTWTILLTETNNKKIDGKIKWTKKVIQNKDK